MGGARAAGAALADVWLNQGWRSASVSGMRVDGLESSKRRMKSCAVTSPECH